MSKTTATKTDTSQVINKLNGPFIINNNNNNNKNCNAHISTLLGVQGAVKQKTKQKQNTTQICKLHT